MLPDIRRAVRVILTLVVAYGSAFNISLHAQAPDDGSSLRVYLMTVEPGDEIWEKFGHDALWVIDERTGFGESYNYGIFDDKQPNFIPNFLRGRMLYSMGEAPRSPDGELQHYASYNRSVIVQELNLQPAQRRALRDFLAWNNLPENSSYRYDYFRDNCATRIRDAIDRATNGQLKTALTARDAGTTYRWQARRMLADEALAYTGIELGLANPVDQPLTAWDDSFLPMQLMAHVRTVQVRGTNGALEPLVLQERALFQSDRNPARIAPPDRTVAHTALGILIGVLLLVLGSLASHDHRIAARVAFGVLGFLWSFGIGVFGLVITLLWSVTDHTATYWNENIFQANVLSIGLAFLVALLVLGRAGKAVWRLALAVAGASVLGLVVQVLPGFDQVNGEIIGLALPAHLGLLAGIGYFYRYKVSPAGDGSKGGGAAPHGFPGGTPLAPVPAEVGPTNQTRKS